ncbi:hypothetical protein CHI12_10690 [Terribacillus saccharophilus]|uniref:DUF4832 domain-containing protein n=2 Tax=Terribacillus saccharophilus TaxID=361277 RepID=A0A268HCA9_9BACI|nr:hypothetical protein CHI12_10690 [Terribacillus saccharophilus]
MEVNMKQKTKFVQYFFVLVLITTLAVTPTNLKADAASSETITMIDDFENYTSDDQMKSAYELWSSDGNGADWSLSQEHTNDGENSMQIVPNEPLDSWVSVSHNSSLRDWTNSAGISFWIHNDADEPLEFNFDIKSESKAFGQEGTFTASLKEDGSSLWEENSFESMLTVPADFTGHIRMAWNQFTEKAWQCPQGCDNDLDLTLVEGFEFGYNPQENSTNEIFIDSISLWGVSEDTELGTLAPEWATPSNTFNLNYTAAPIDNPLKGFLPFSESAEWRIDNQMPYSMEYFYIPLNEIMTNFNEFDWSKLESNIDDVASRGNQAIFRVYLDYPNRSSGIPQFLLDLGLETKDYSYNSNGGPEGTSVSPDYDDENLNTALHQFIEALGDRYDGDPRIGFIQAGLVGFWGEWHTYPQDGSTPAGDWDGELAEHEDGRATNWMPNLANQAAIVQEFDDSFDETKILARYPSEFNRDLNIGYHDDSFAFQTLPASLGGEDWHFVGRLQDNQVMDKWKVEPIGGEMRPEIQIDMWDNDPPQYIGEPIEGAQGEDYYKSLELTHASWLKIQEVFQTSLEGEALDRAREGSRSLGYEYFVPTGYVHAANGRLQAAIEIQNTGVAPFYYDWKVEIAARDKNGNIKERATDWDVSNVLPDDEETEDNKGTLLEWSTDTSELSEGSYDMLVRVVNPLSEINSNAKKFHFANEEQEDNGWLKIGEIEL